MLTVQVQGGTQIYDSTRPKVFAVPAGGDHPRGGLLGYFGNAMVGQMHDTQRFCDDLLNRLTASVTPQQMRSVQGFHFGAFERRHGHRAPVFRFIRNAEIGPGDRYGQFPQWQFRSDEQLLGRDYASIAPQDVRSQLVTCEEVERIPVCARSHVKVRGGGQPKSAPSTV